MFKNLTYQKKSYLIIGGFVLALLIAYKLSFAKTFHLLNENTQKQEKLIWLKIKKKKFPTYNRKWLY